MALYSPSPVYPNVADYPSPSSNPPSPPRSSSQRHVSKSERMLLATLRRADQAQREKASAEDSDSIDYFGRAMQSAWSRSNSVNASPVRGYKTLHLAVPEECSRSSSPVPGGESSAPLATRRGRTPSPSPHPYRTQSPNLVRTQTAPVEPITSPSKGLIRTSTSPSPQSTLRREASKRSAHEELLRSRLEGVLAKQQSNERSSSTTRSRGPSFSRTTVTGDQWAWSQSQSINAPLNVQIPPSSTVPLKRTPSVTRATPQRNTSSSHLSSMVSPSRIREAVMITPPPSPPYATRQGSSAVDVVPDSCSPALSRNPSQARRNNTPTMGVNRPSNEASRSPSSTRVTPPPFDARSVSEALKQQDGYVSFCEIEGLGEPEGMDGEDSGEEDGECRGRGKWWEVWK